jgi:hypothetical protein
MIIKKYFKIIQVNNILKKIRMLYIYNNNIKVDKIKKLKLIIKID